MAISVIVYGRNDSHGYNYDKRIALSLNSIAYSLSELDEIIFVDWNTPIGLPPKLVSIADTLSERAKARTNVIVVTPEIHRALLPKGVDRQILEPHARNVGIRYAQTNSDWILSTNTDVIFNARTVNWQERLVTTTCSYIACPRFELPEWMWEAMPRSLEDPSDYLDAYRQHFDFERSIQSHEYCLFDAPGDFQLVRRDLLNTIGGFDQSMIYGWHVDSNLAKRVWLESHAIESIGDAMAIYHCNHSRTPTSYQHVRSRSNDPIRNVDMVLPGEQRLVQEGWGLQDLGLTKQTVSELLSKSKLVATVDWGFSDRNGGETEYSRLDTTTCAQGFTASESWPFILDHISGSGAFVDVHYLGRRADMVNALRLSVELGISKSLSILQAEDLERPLRGVVLVDLSPNDPVRLGPLGEPQFSESDAMYLEETLTRIIHGRPREVTDSPSNSKLRWIFINSEENQLSAFIGTSFHLLPAQFYSHISLGIPMRPRRRSMKVLVPVAHLLDGVANSTRKWRKAVRIPSNVTGGSVVNGGLRKNLTSMFRVSILAGERWIAPFRALVLRETSRTLRLQRYDDVSVEQTTKTTPEQ